MKRSVVYVVAVTALLFVSSGQALQAQDRLYGITFFTNQLITFDTSDGSTTLVGPLGASVAPFGIANRFDLLYTYDSVQDQIRTIDPASGSLLGSPIDISIGNLTGEGDLAFRADGLGFLTSAFDATGAFAPSLYTFDLNSGTSARIGTTAIAGEGAVTIDGLSFSRDGTLYALANGDGRLFTLNESTGLLTVVGELGVAQNSFFAGLTFGPDDVLYGAIDDQLFTINPSNGAATLVDLSGFGSSFGSVSGLAFAPIPEPSATVWAMIAATFCLANRRRHRKA